MFFTAKNRKKNLTFLFVALFLFSGVIFAFSNVQSVHAQSVGCVAGPAGCALGQLGGIALEKLGISTSDAVSYPFKLILLGLFTMLGWVASVAITLFEWVIKPENYSGTTGVLNQPAVYEMWKFIRDFFNLFFILVLLYIAFSVVFQIEKNFKKTILSLVLAALFINFSYPVSRALVDVANVPMYFFANQMAASNGASADSPGSVFSSALSASHIKGVLIPGAENGGSVKTVDNSFARYFIAIIFIFLFSVTLLVLAVMFTIRLVALVILVIFSPVGFAASIIPGLKTYSDMWWKSFSKYAIFGPAAMLMLLVATRFFAALGDEKTGVFSSLKSEATKQVASDPTFFASMALFTLPIIMLWMAMILAQKMSIAGASSVVGLGKKFSIGAMKKFSGYNMAERNVKAYSAERKKRSDEAMKTSWLGTKLGTTFGKKTNQAQDKLHATLPIPGSTAAQKRANKMRTAENKEDIKSATEKNDGAPTSTLVTNVNTAIITPPATRDGHINAAADAKQALSRGKEFEIEIENQINNGTLVPPAGTVPPGTPPAAAQQLIKAWYYGQMRTIIANAEKA